MDAQSNKTQERIGQLYNNGYNSSPLKVTYQTNLTISDIKTYFQLISPGLLQNLEKNSVPLNCSEQFVNTLDSSGIDKYMVVSPLSNRLGYLEGDAIPEEIKEISSNLQKEPGQKSISFFRRCESSNHNQNGSDFNFIMYGIAGDEEKSGKIVFTYPNGSETKEILLGEDRFISFSCSSFIGMTLSKELYLICNGSDGEYNNSILYRVDFIQGNTSIIKQVATKIINTHELE